MSKKHNRRHPTGLEWMILRKLPNVIFAGIFIPLFMSIFARFLPVAGTAAEITRHQIDIDILSISLFFIVISAAFTMTIGCIIVVGMKGPNFVTDAYELEDSNHPMPGNKSDKRLNR